MKKFHFKLETVLKLKEKILDDKMLELAQITKVLNDAQEKRLIIVQEKNNINDYIIDIYQKENNIDYVAIDRYRNYMVKLDNQIKHQDAIIEQIKMAVKTKQKEVQEALKERDILKKLKEKQREKHYKEINHKEAVELDELAICRYKVS